MFSLDSQDYVKGMRKSGFLLVFLNANLSTFHTRILRVVKFNDCTFDSGRILLVLIICIKKVLCVSYAMNSTFKIFM